MLRNIDDCSIEVSFKFEDPDGFIELCFHCKKSMDGQTAEEGDGTSDFKGWSIRPHQDPTRVV